MYLFLFFVGKQSIYTRIAYRKKWGKYVLSFKSGNQYYLQGDATCSIPIFYNLGDKFICSSNYQYIVSKKKYSVDDEFSIIRQSSDISQVMPYDITKYRTIKQLIPNHYLDINKQIAVRFINISNRQKNISVESWSYVKI